MKFGATRENADFALQYCEYTADAKIKSFFSLIFFVAQHWELVYSYNKGTLGSKTI